MAAYHLNDSGEPGLCKATKGGCPFGGAHNHYETPAIAQQAYELSMAKSTLTSHSKTTERPVYPIEGDTVKISHSAVSHNAMFAKYVGKTGVVQEFTGTSYKVKFDDGQVHSFHYSLVGPRPVSKDKASAYPPLGNEYTAALNKMELNALQGELDNLRADSALPLEEKSARLEAVKAAVESYYPRNYNGFTKDELVFNEAAYDARVQAIATISSNNRTPEQLERQKADAVAAWESAARTERAKSHEEGVPIRLIPTGAEVYSPYAKGSPWRKVGVPVDNGPVWNPETRTADGPHDIVGKYHDGVQWDYVTPDTRFKTGYVPNDKALSPRWKAENNKAAELQLMREKAKLDGVK